MNTRLNQLCQIRRLFYFVLPTLIMTYDVMIVVIGTNPTLPLAIYNDKFIMLASGPSGV
jgi:hypothetical protein